MPAPLVVANWKMHTTLEEARALTGALLPGLGGLAGVEVVLCPPFPWLTEVARLAEGSGVALGAQNADYHDQGGFTGEVSPRMLKGLCRYVLLGQYERRIHHGERDGILKLKIEAARQHGLVPIYCTGDNADALHEDEGFAMVAEQVEMALEDVPNDARLVVAYDPSWTTIGLVTPPPLEYAGEMCAHIRDTLAALSSREAAERVRILYGGSLTPRNAAEVAALPGVDGVLVGSGSVNADNFVAIARAFAEAAAGRASA